MTVDLLVGALTSAFMYVLWIDVFVWRLQVGCFALVFPIRNKAPTLDAVARPLDEHPAD